MAVYIMSLIKLKVNLVLDTPLKEILFNTFFQYMSLSSLEIVSLQSKPAHFKGKIIPLNKYPLSFYLE